MTGDRSECRESILFARHCRFDWGAGLTNIPAEGGRCAARSDFQPPESNRNRPLDGCPTRPEGNPLAEVISLPTTASEPRATRLRRRPSGRNRTAPCAMPGAAIQKCAQWEAARCV